MRVAALASLGFSIAASLAVLARIAAEDWSAGLMIHGVAFGAGTLGLWLWMRALACNQRGLLPITLIMTALIPGFGVLSLPLAAAYGARNPLAKAEDNTMVVEVPRLPFKPLATDQALSFSRGGLFEVLERSTDTDKQVVAVMATTRMKSKQAVPLLKVAMRDEADDVRLLAYSIKDKKESEINGKIKRLIQVLEDNEQGQGRKRLSNRERATTERSLAFLYWELVYLDLAEGDIRTFFLDQVVARATSALAHMAYGPLAVLLARAYMEQSEYAAAEDALDLAERTDVERLVLATYRAEIAFHQGRFFEVRTRLLEVGASPHEAMREVLDYWLSAA